VLRGAVILVLALASSPAAGRFSPEDLGLPFAVEDVNGQVGLMTRPPGTTTTHRLPAVLLVHDTLGPDLRSLPYVEQIAAAGLLVLEIAPEPDEDAVATVRRGLAALAAHPQADATRIGLLGFGGGARAAVVAAAPDDPFAARVLLYPGCATLLRDLPAAPVLDRGRLLLMHGAEDLANAEADCAALAQRLGGSLPARHLAFRGASYAWDFPSADPQAPWLYPVPGSDGRVRIRPWPALTALSASEVASFLAAALRTRGL
jgi:dienelactone hydrolase